MNTKLSDDLLQIQSRSSSSITLQDLADQTGQRGILLVMLVLNIPFILPIPIPHLSTPFGVALLFHCTKLAWGIPKKLPAFVGSKPIPQKILYTILEKCIWGAQKIELKIHERFSVFIESPAFRGLNIFLFFLMSFILTLPLLFPFTNFFPSATMILLAVGLIEKDGLLIVLSYVAAILSFVYLYLLFLFGSEVFHWIAEFFKKLF